MVRGHVALTESEPEPAGDAGGLCGFRLGGDGAFAAEGDSDAERLALINFFDAAILWDHTDLTAAVLAGENADPALAAKIREAISIWGDVLQRHLEGLVTLTNISDEHEQAVPADMRVHFTTWGTR